VVLVECFNRFLNAGLHVLDNNCETNRVFVEGAQMLTYALNSCPKLGTGLSRSLFTIGQEFFSPIDHVANQKTVNEMSDNEKKLLG
jgi:hypothetical protein